MNAKLQPYSRPAALAKLDGRTREARLVRDVRADLVKHVGGNPSATQLWLIEQAIQLKLRLALMDAKLAETKEQTAHDSRTYLAWSNSFSRILRQIGMKGAAEKPPSLAEYLAERDKPAGAGTGAASAAPIRTGGPVKPLAGPQNGPTGAV